jgi:hypothetical protein
MPADFDGDSKAEFVVFQPSNGVWYSLNLVGNTFSAVQFGSLKISLSQQISMEMEKLTKQSIARRMAPGVFWEAGKALRQFNLVFRLIFPPG